jgi:GNAT superfamily N-acetyltransferase
VTPQTSLTILRCHDASIIGDILSDEYFDEPVCFFPRRLVQAAPRWLANSNQVYFMVALASGQRAAFVLGHTIGPRLWRVFALRHLYLFPHLLWVLMNQRVFKSPRYPSSRLGHARSHPDPENLAELALPSVDTLFAWSVPDSRTGYIALLYVAESFRGQGIASLLLEATLHQMRQDGVRKVEARIDSTNYASARAFVRADWKVVRRSTNDFHASTASKDEQ